jgi:hypothetical protein
MGSKTIGITGGTGFIGRHIARNLAAAGHSVIVFTRSPKAAEGNIRYALWRPDSEQIDGSALQEVEAVIHLAGAGVADKRWTPERKEEIMSSRVAATHFLHHALRADAPACKVFVAASASGYYGPDRDGLTPFTEDAPPYNDFLAGVCVAWESASFSASGRYRTAVLRIGIVLGKDGGAFPKLAGPMRFGVMPVLGSGQQMVSWIHVEDLAQLFVTAALNERFQGVCNAAAPHPVTHRKLMKTIAAAKGGLRIPVPVPAWALRVIMGEASAEVLKSCTLSCKKVLELGFQFRFPDLKDAIQDIVTS